MRVKIRYYQIKRGARGGIRRFWSPSMKLLGGGWKLVRLHDDEGLAIAQAEAINAALDAWRTGTPAAAPKAHADVVLAAAPAGAVAGDTRKPDGKKVKRAAPEGTLPALVHAYRKSTDYPANAKTARGYEQNIGLLLDWSARAGNPPLTEITPQDLKALWEALRTRAPVRATAAIGMARALLNWGRVAGYYQGYYARDAKGRAVRDEGGRRVFVTATPKHNAASALGLIGSKPTRTEDDLWTPEEVQIFAAVAEHMGWPSVGLAVQLNEWCGQRQGDILAMPDAAYRAGRVSIRQSKTGAQVALPVDLVPSLLDALETNRVRKIDARRAAEDKARERSTAAIHATTLLIAESTGQAWKEDHFRHIFADVRAEAAKWCPSLERKQFMLLRHTAIVRNAEAGCDVAEIISISGHTMASANTILERYNVRTRAAAEGAFRRRLKANQDTDNQNPT
jgi:hypothetical protein